MLKSEQEHRWRCCLEHWDLRDAGGKARHVLAQVLESPAHEEIWDDFPQ